MHTPHSSPGSTKLVSLGAYLSLVVLAACAPSDGRPHEARYGTASTLPPVVASTPVAVRASSGYADSEPPPGSADQHFLRDMLDHHEGLIYLGHRAMERYDRTRPRDDALLLDETRDADKRQMLRILRTIYSDRHEPAVLPADRASADSVVLLAGPTYDRHLRQIIIERDKGGIALIDRFMPRLTRSDVRELARSMRSASRKEITQYSSGGVLAPPRRR